MATSKKPSKQPNEGRPTAASVSAEASAKGLPKPAPTRTRLPGGAGKPIAFRLPEPERQAWLAKVTASGLTQSEFFRQAVLTNRTTIQAHSRGGADLKRLVYHFNKAGNNLNQLAHRAHGDRLAGKLNQATYESIEYQLQLIAKYLKATIEGAR